VAMLTVEAKKKGQTTCFEKIKVHFFHSKLFGLKPTSNFQAIAVRIKAVVIKLKPKTTSSFPFRPKPIYSIPSHSIPAKTNFLHSKPFQSGNIVSQSFLLFLPCCSWSPNYSVFVHLT
jgi:hypothetical protein